MGDKRWYEGRWVRRFVYDDVAYMPDRWLDEAELGHYPRDDDKTYSIVLPHRELSQLIEFLTKNGYIKPTFAENRTEDIKVIHRLIDVVEKTVPHRED